MIRLRRKIIISSIAVFTLFISILGTTARANGNLEHEIINLNNKVQGIEEISEKKYIEIVALEKNISIEKVKEMELQENKLLKEKLYEKIENGKLQEEFPNLKNYKKEDIKKLAASGYYTYNTISGTKTYDRNKSFKAEVNATLKIYNFNNTSVRQIAALQGSVSSKPVTGTHNYKWNQQSKWADPTGGKYPTSKITIGASGYFSITTTAGISGGVPGFSVSGSTNTYYTSDYINITRTFSCYN